VGATIERSEVRGQKVRRTEGQKVRKTDRNAFRLFAFFRFLFVNSKRSEYRE
jgi:hypothetical protein